MIQFICFRSGVFAEEHRPIERNQHHEPVEVSSSKLRVVTGEQSARGELLEDDGQRSDRAGGSLFAECAAEFWKARRLGNYQPAQLKHTRLHDESKLTTRKLAEGSPNDGTLGEAVNLREN